MQMFVAVLLCLTLASIACGQMSIPKRKVGFVYGQARSNVSVYLDVYIDLACPDSKRVWPTVMQVADHYGPEVLQLTTHLFPLPYHRCAYQTAKAAHAVHELSNGQKTYDWFNTTFVHQYNFSNGPTFTLSEADVVQRLVSLANTLLPGQADQFEYKLTSSLPLELDTRVAWKYACTRGVTSTPIFMVNDVVLDADYMWTLTEWRNVLDPLVQP